MYSVNYWGSNPHDDNDDCWTGDDFETLAEAEKVFARPCDAGRYAPSHTVAYIQLLDPNGVELKLRKNPGFQPRDQNDGEWRREIAMQAGMMGGCEAYNEAIGWD